jgi:hypothetical protein
MSLQAHGRAPARGRPSKDAKQREKNIRHHSLNFHLALPLELLDQAFTRAMPPRQRFSERLDEDAIETNLTAAEKEQDR